MNALGRVIRRRLIAGLIVIAPLGVTLYILWWMFATVDGLLGNYLPGRMRIPGLGLVLLVAILVGVGWAAERTIGAQVLNWWHDFLNRVPVVSRLYGAIRRIVGSVFGGGEKRFFKEVVLFQFPLPGQWSLGFVTGAAPRALNDEMEDGVTIFLPTSPNPVTGFLIIVARENTIRLPITVEEGFTFILSAGAVPPGGVSPFGPTVPTTGPGAAPAGARPPAKASAASHASPPPASTPPRAPDFEPR